MNNSDFIKIQHVGIVVQQAELRGMSTGAEIDPAPVLSQLPSYAPELQQMMAEVLGLLLPSRKPV